MKKACTISIALAVILYFALPAQAALFLDTWGVSPGSWAPTSAPSHLFWVQEDYTASGPGFIDPGWGGQRFDAEAAYIGIDYTTIYLAVVTGLPQKGGKDIWRYNNPSYPYHDWNKSLEKYWYDPGDIGIDINSDGTYEFAVTTRSDSTNSSYAPTPGEGLLLSGNLVWENPKAWDTETKYTNWGGVSNPWAVTGYDKAVDLGANFSYDAFGTDHYAIEVILDTSQLGLSYGDKFTIHWTMECGNDFIDLYDPLAEIPEPSTMLLLSTGIAGLAFYSRRKFRK